MRQVTDAGMAQRAADSIREHIADPFTSPRKGDDRPRYFRGALIKSKPETKTNGK